MGEKAGEIALASSCRGSNLTRMSKIFYVLLTVAFLPLLSCGQNSETVKKPVGPTTDESDMPWNRPTGPEGAGALGILDQR